MSVLSGQITVAAAGTAVAGPATPLGSYFVLMFRAAFNTTADIYGDDFSVRRVN